MVSTRTPPPLAALRMLRPLAGAAPVAGSVCPRRCAADRGACPPPATERCSPSTAAVVTLWPQPKLCQMADCWHLMENAG